MTSKKAFSLKKPPVFKENFFQERNKKGKRESLAFVLLENDYFNFPSRPVSLTESNTQAIASNSGVSLGTEEEQEKKKNNRRTWQRTCLIRGLKRIIDFVVGSKYFFWSRNRVLFSGSGTNVRAEVRCFPSSFRAYQKR
ncbi:hypothetical protein TNCT_348961 [Trichonephila clavata]|uniref:Uncharacterized protein n=1 Tax=Trichonephila clavata TaxID=2740835 RepID=A0A8X6GND7_TRICU|nr:hypothetical protein TNCT_348961 [Trichonephila clavata]